MHVKFYCKVGWENRVYHKTRQKVNAEYYLCLNLKNADQLDLDFYL